MNALVNERVRWWQSLSGEAQEFWTAIGAGSIEGAWEMFKVAKCATTGISLRFCMCSQHHVTVRVPA